MIPCLPAFVKTHSERDRHWRTLVGSAEYKEALQLISRNEEKLQATMTDAQKELFSRYADSVREFQDMAECLLFQNSFRLGARMMLDIMDEWEL